MKDTNVAGVPLLIVAGAGFLYVALTSQRLIQVNKDGVTFARIQSLERTLDQVSKDPEIPTAAKVRIADVAESNGIDLSPQFSAIQLESAVYKVLTAMGVEHGFSVRQSKGPADRGWDLLVVNGAGRRLAVEIKTRLRPSGFADVIRKLRHLDVPDRLLVVDRGIPYGLSDAFEGDHIWVLNWDPEDEDSALEILRRMGFVE